MTNHTLTSADSRAAGSGPGEHVLELDAVTAGYGDLAAIRHVSLHVRRGEVVALAGPNGAGKTTTLLAAIGAIPRSNGDVRWLGGPAPKSVHAFARAGLAFVPEERSVTSGLSVADNLRLGKGSVDAALDYFPELKSLLPRSAGLLSGGEQQMLTLARALASEPNALLVDELSLGLAPMMVDRLMDVISVAAKDGLAVILVEQQARRALAVADRWYLFRNGTVVSEGDSNSGTEALDEAYHLDTSTNPQPE